jgi:hypothetical protein
MKRFFLIIFLAIFLGFLTPAVFAQEVSLGTATLVEMSEKPVDGDIVSSQKGGGFILSKTPYEPFLFGVVSMRPALYLYDKAVKNGVPVINNGKAFVRVTTEKGVINRGDPITSSTTPGVGIKATDNGYIVGTAEEEYKERDPKKVGKILVAVDPRFAQINTNLLATLFSLPRLSFSATILTPLNSLRYLVAGIIAAASFYLGFRFFGHVSVSGVEAIGRNPLARRSILVSVFVNAFLTVCVILIGFGVAYLILAL